MTMTFLDQVRAVGAGLGHLLSERGADVLRYGIRRAAEIEKYELHVKAAGADLATYRLLIAEGTDPYRAFQETMTDYTYAPVSKADS